MKKVAIIIGLVLLFLFLCQNFVMSAELINQPSTLLFNTGLVLFGSQIFALIVLISQTHKLIVNWSKKPEVEQQTEIKTQPEEVLIESPVVNKKKKYYYKPKKKSEFPIGGTENKEKKSNLKPKKDE